MSLGAVVLGVVRLIFASLVLVGMIVF